MVTWLLLLCALFLPTAAHAGSATLSWIANTESDLAGYKLYQGTVSGQYGPPIDVGNVITYSPTLPTLTTDQTYFWALTAYDKSGNESSKSSEVSKLIQAIRMSMVASLQGDPATGPWAVLATPTNAPTSPYTVDVYVNGVLDHTETADPRCSWGDSGGPCTQITKPTGTYVVEFRAMQGTVELARTSLTVVVPDRTAPMPPTGLQVR